MRFRWFIAVLLAGGGMLSPAQTKTTSDAQAPASTKESSYVPVHKFDEKRDAAADIQAAIKEAQKTGKRVLVDVGGDWCSWCHVLDKLFEQHPEIVEIRDKNFITVAVFYSLENKNEKVLSHYPKVGEIPYFFVLEKDGTVLHSQGIVQLETGGEPNADKMKDFLTKWSPSHAEIAAKPD
jgi:thiol:disulfide interchange protein